MEDTIEKINSSNWSDWMLNDIYIDYEKIEVAITYDSVKLKLVCANFIGIQWIGQWDESIIENISISKSGTLIDRSKELVKQYYSNTPVLGNENKQLNDIWLQINIAFIDGISLLIACKEIKTIEI